MDEEYIITFIITTNLYNGEILESIEDFIMLN